MAAYPSPTPSFTPPPPPPPHPHPQEPHLLSLRVVRSRQPFLAASNDGAGAGRNRAVKRAGGASDGGEAGGGGEAEGEAFGTLYLGETLSCLLTLTNDFPSGVAHYPTLRIELHTSISPQTGQAANKHLLFSSPVSHSSSSDDHDNAVLRPGQSSEVQVQHEIKELGNNALVCTVQYGQEIEVEGVERERRVLSRSFRKIYQFTSTSPLSVRTKAHSPPALSASPSLPNGTSSTSALSPTQRSLIFLEVQVHNQHVSPLSFERMRFEPLLPQPPSQPALSLAEGFADPNEGLFENQNDKEKEQDAFLPPGGVRQFLYVLQQTEEERKRAVPGNSQGLGRLDIVWRTPTGEIGRLQSSTLGRRIPPLPLNPSSASAAPLPIPSSSLHPQAGLAPSRPSLSSRTPTPDLLFPPATHTPLAPSSAPSAPSPNAPSAEGLVFDFTVQDLPSSSPAIQVDRPFALSFRLGVSALAPPLAAAGHPHPPLRRRRIRLAAQHVEPFPSSAPSSSSSSAVPPSAGGVTTLQQQQQLTAARASLDSVQSSSSASASASVFSFPFPTAAAVAVPQRPKINGIALPLPYPSSSSSSTTLPSPDVLRLGPSVVDLGWLDLPPSSSSASIDGGEQPEKQAEIAWSMRFLPLSTGLKRVGGVRVLLLDSVWVDVDGERIEAEEGKEGEKDREGEGKERQATVLGEWAVVGEVWVGSGGGGGGAV
ncbi:hypothetical protein JCM10213_003241 [Rhodosporidiobolus nylandii]